MEKCPRATCYSPEVACDLGHRDYTCCPSWKTKGPSKQDVQQASESIAMPWSGNSLGLTDLSFVAGRGKPYVLAIVGPENAGKTTLLAAWYLLLGRGLRTADGLRFSGSYSLTGWENIANFLRWSPGPLKPTFPPHTTTAGGRMPGLLHFGFTSDDGLRQDYVMTDAPGLWFQKWGINRDAHDAEGARWVAEHADAFLLIADCEALAGSTMGKARGNIQTLARRLGSERRDRPVAFVWAKTDVDISRETEEVVRDSILKQMPDAREFRISILSACDEAKVNGQGHLDLLQWALNTQRNPVVLPETVPYKADPLLLFGRRQQ